MTYLNDLHAACNKYTDVFSPGFVERKLTVEATGVVLFGHQRMPEPLVVRPVEALARLDKLAAVKLHRHHDKDLARLREALDHDWVPAAIEAADAELIRLQLVMLERESAAANAVVAPEMDLPNILRACSRHASAVANRDRAQDRLAFLRSRQHEINAQSRDNLVARIDAMRAAGVAWAAELFDWKQWLDATRAEGNRPE